MGSDSEFEWHGPAQLHRECITYKQKLSLSLDLVYCVRCLSWPLQAADWPSRQRNYGWPDSATVGRVVSNGCDAVHAPHRQCREDEWMRKHQWRLSFSRAEIALINSWMPLQQITYHMLRVFMRTEQLTETANNSGVGTLSNYHIKTLMLWVCELKSLSWWTDDSSFVRICVELLHTLAVWLIEARCPHYFISNCNLVDKSFVLQRTGSRLLLIDKDWLSSWFVNGYMKQSVQMCPKNILRLFDDVSTRIKLDHAVSAVVDWRLNTTTVDLWREFDLSEICIAHQVSIHSVCERTCVYLTKELSKIDGRLSVYFTILVLLNVAIKTGKCCLIENLIKGLVITTSQLIVSSNYGDEHELLLVYKVNALQRKYQQLAVNSTNISASDLVELLQQSSAELLTSFRQLEAHDFGSVVTIVTTDFEALYAYKQGDYQRCLQLSTQNVHTLLSAKRVHSIPIFPEFLQFLDDDIISLTALTLIVDPECRDDRCYACVTQLTLSLYLMTQCQLKLRHSFSSLALTLDYIEIAERTHEGDSLDHLTLKLTERKLTYCATSVLFGKRYDL